MSNINSFGKKGVKYFIGYEDAKITDLYVYFSEQWVHIEETLMILDNNFNKRWSITRKI